MITGYVVTFILLAFSVFFVLTKRDMVAKMGAMFNVPSTNKFQEELEKTGEEIIKRLEYQVAQLEFLVEEADQRIKMLDSRLQQLDGFFEKSEPSTAVPVDSVNAFEHAINNYAQAMSMNSQENKRVLSEKTFGEINNDKKSLILAMAEQGYDITEIARATAMGKGEVALVLQFNKK